MFKQVLFTLGIAAVAACGGKSDSSGGFGIRMPPASSAQPAAGTGVELGEMTIYEGKEVMARIHADGSTELGASNGSGASTFEPGPVIKPDGSFTDKTGTARAKLNADGTITDTGSNQALPILVTADTVTITDQGQQHRISLAADGTIQLPQPQPPDKTPRVEGADTAGKRRVVLALVGLLLAPGEQAPAPDAHVSVPVGQ